MNKCWFVLEQPFFTPPKYAHPSKAGGKAEGPLRLGDIVPSVKDIYPILTQGPLPPFTLDMFITDTRVCDFEWNTSRDHEVGSEIGAGAPITGAAGATINAELKATFRKTVKNWVTFKTLDCEIMQPSRKYINGALAKEGVKDHLEDSKTPLLNQWTVYMVTGLLIARAGGKIGSSTSGSIGISGGPDVDIPGVVKTMFTNSVSNDAETSTSAKIQGDRIWAVRFAKVHKGLLRPRWRQTEETAGAALTGSVTDEKVIEVLKDEGIADVEIAETVTDDNKFVFVTSLGTSKN